MIIFYLFVIIYNEVDTAVLSSYIYVMYITCIKNKIKKSIPI